MAYRLSTACRDTKSAGTLKVSKKISADFSRFLQGWRVQGVDGRFRVQVARCRV